MKTITAILCFWAVFASYGVLAEDNPAPVSGEAGADCRIIITTPGYTSVYRYGLDDFCSGLRRDLRVFDASLECRDSLGVKLVDVVINGRKSSFEVSSEIPVVRFVYDRNRRRFSPVGINYRGNIVSALPDSVCSQEIPVPCLPADWNPEIVKQLVGANNFEAVKGRVLIMDADMDENGIVRHITEVGGAPKQTSQAVIDYLYEMIARGWKPLKTGVTKRTIVPLVIRIG